MQNFYSDSYTQLDIDANNISLSTVEGGAERLAGLYLLAYKNGGSSDLIVNLTANEKVEISGFERGITTFGSANVTINAKYIDIIADTDGGRGLNLNGYDAEKSTVISLGSGNSTEKINIVGDKYGIYADDRVEVGIQSKIVNIEGNNGWGICLFDNSLTDVTADNTSINGHIYSKNSDVLIKSDTTNVTGQVKALDGANVDFSSKADSTSGITQVLTNGINAVVTTSDTTEQSIVDFNQNTVINAYQMNGDTYVTDYHNNPYERDAIAIQANRNSQVNLNTEGNSYALYGDIIAGRGEESNAVGGEINIGGTGTIIRGDILAGNTGKIDINLINGNIEGRIDDYGDAGNGNVFDPKEFDVAVTESGNIGVTLKDSVWTARHQSWVTSLELDNSLVDLTKDEASSVTIGKLSGSGVFNMRLNSEDHSKGDMLYIGEGSGTHTVNIVGGITGGLENISEDNPLRFATVKNSGGILEVAGSGINAFTKDAGIYDLEYFVTKEDFDKNDEENEVYNGGADGSIVDETGGHKGFKPGNNFVENVLDADGTAENWIITGVKEKKESDTVDTIINMSHANYKNAVYMDRLNKRLGEARYIDGDEGMWVRMRHDRIGMKDEFRSMNTMYQLGYDKLDNKDDKGERHIGAAIDYMDGSTSYSDIYGEGETRRWGFWMYDTWLGSKGHYADYVAKFGHMHNEFDIRSMNTGEKITGDYDNNVFSISAEYGRKKDIGNNWYFEPQAQLQLARVTDAEYKTSQDTDVYVDGINSLIGRAGFRLGKDVDERSTVYVKADVLHEFLGDQRIVAGDVTGSLDKTYENKGTWYDVGFGFATAVGHDSYAYLDFEKSFGNDNDDTYQINAGLQWNF
jgi:outer membrane autotransporter protein